MAPGAGWSGLDVPSLYCFLHNLAGDNSEEATPDPIPNSEVKLFCVDGTAWVTTWESRSLPAFFVFVARLRRRCVGRVRQYASLLAPSSHHNKNKKTIFSILTGICVVSRRKRPQLRTLSTRLWPFSLLPSICTDKIEKRE